MERQLRHVGGLQKRLGSVEIKAHDAVPLGQCDLLPVVDLGHKRRLLLIEVCQRLVLFDGLLQKLGPFFHQRLQFALHLQKVSLGLSPGHGADLLAFFFNDLVQVFQILVDNVLQNIALLVIHDLVLQSLEIGIVLVAVVPAVDGRDRRSFGDGLSLLG